MEQCWSRPRRQGRPVARFYRQSGCGKILGCHWSLRVIFARLQAVESHTALVPSSKSCHGHCSAGGGRACQAAQQADNSAILTSASTWLPAATYKLAAWAGRSTRANSTTAERKCHVSFRTRSRARVASHACKATSAGCSLAFPVDVVTPTSCGFKCCMLRGNSGTGPWWLRRRWRQPQPHPRTPCSPPRPW